MRVTIRKKRWELVFRNLRNQKRRGYCEAPHEKGKEIVVDSRLRGQERIEVILHELIHSAHYSLLDEEFVETTARDISRVLFQLGYRAHDEREERDDEE